METVLIGLAASCAVMILWYDRALGERPTSTLLRRAVDVSKYIAGLFLSTFGSAALALLVVTPLLLYRSLAHSEIAANLFSTLLDRPYFPLQTVLAFVAGLATAKWLKDGKPGLVWVLPVAQFFAGLFILSSRRSVFDTSGQFIWNTFFNWGCECPASLLQWKVMFPMYTSVAFSVAACLRSLKSAEPTSPTLAQE